MNSEDASSKLLDYGKISWLWAASKMHVKWPVGLQARILLPAIGTGQYSILDGENYPRAYCCWAFLDAESEMQYIQDPTSLRPEQWTSGDRLWFVDWVSPFDRFATRELRRRIADMFPYHLGRSIHVKPGQNTARVGFFPGKGLSKEQLARLRETYLENVMKLAEKAPVRTDRTRS